MTTKNNTYTKYFTRSYSIYLRNVHHSIKKYIEQNKEKPEAKQIGGTICKYLEEGEEKIKEIISRETVLYAWVRSCKRLQKKMRKALRVP